MKKPATWGGLVSVGDLRRAAHGYEPTREATMAAFGSLEHEGIPQRATSAANSCPKARL